MLDNEHSVLKHCAKIFMSRHPREKIFPWVVQKYSFKNKYSAGTLNDFGLPT